MRNVANNTFCYIFDNYVNSSGCFQRGLRRFDKMFTNYLMKYRLVNAMKNIEYSVFLCFLGELLLVNPLFYFLQKLKTP